jgi:dihydropteroate synthase
MAWRSGAAIKPSDFLAATNAARCARPLVMGIVNVTPDSFFDGGRHGDLDGAIRHARRLIDEGADVLDIGGETTRPGAEPLSQAEEVARVLPVIEALAASTGVAISIDTMKPAVARLAMAAGAVMWNDVTALRFSADAPATAADLGCQVVLMHMQGEPRTMQDDPRYDDVAAEVAAFLAERAAAAQGAGVARERIWLDPGIGFGKTAAHNLALLRALPALVGLGYPVVLGASRKGFIRAVDPSATVPGDRLGASLGLALAGARAGAAMVRVHDVRETVQALAMEAALAGEVDDG